MNGRRDDLRISTIAGLRLGMRRNWGLAGCGLGTLATLLLAIWLILRQSAFLLETEEAEIVRFGAHGDLDGAHYLIVLRLRNGRLVTIPVGQRLLARCRPGDRIRVARQGGVIGGADSSTCRSPAGPFARPRGP